MKLLVCIKQIPDMESQFKPDESGSWFEESGLVYRMNEYDDYAVEQAVLLKEQLGGEPDLTVLSIGPDRVVEIIKKALAIGCDRGVHIHDPAVAHKDPWQIASLIANFAKEQHYDLIFTGMQSQDRGSAQVGVMAAEQLGYASATTLVGFTYHEGLITGLCELEGGLKGIVKLRTPALVTCQSGLNTPRYPALPNILKAKKKEIRTIPASDLSRAAALTATTRIFKPEKKGSGIILEGDTSTLADRVINLIRENTTLLR
ncbi:MAG: electron transfer flavoprotein subunit beta/FixA family protein [Chlorobiaceae bacterium]|jgi:electron transfer flavoprotein beta subunit|nr:electron transfer flavoprotein subunit beta/FixA family protein [Chlorobiaceae bacterium]NTW63651.1 electron transfer flavoprotein subunit beta/FixA family protein [Chlorobiaceae bacterium]